MSWLIQYALGGGGFEPTTSQLQTGLWGERANDWATAAELNKYCEITKATDSDAMICMHQSMYFIKSYFM